ncbi:MAG: D-alanyl-D-alanine carboxypeptidase/D-alanyl-D-alanine-endopeptidase [Neisseria sp.]|uniref:D-alanyl-D-alanine carboxypeptidase/D-alanyl-D-alanine endopeptidase n=1 Tax=Neisseria sp. TaxID=192066 RepID=UPI0026DCC0A3|nr:D-alanyl-D-alanine carboxypeptidase/D-alanyl-D-alanine-endopeptidase [Neisseria sp.]MDO4640633.1 D-alanyl-D-alanine carboxypeptidase/D-alanyl-D-alanine-endopeptidase [Neisseria sp.]
MKTKMLCLSEKRLRRLSALLLLLCPLAAFALDTGAIPPSEMAVYVQDLQTGQVLQAHQADTAFNPASTMKLVTSFAALRALGPDFAWQTEFKSDADAANGNLNGNIYWVGSGDPVMDQNDLISAQQQLRDQGIRNIKGLLVLDRSIWRGAGSAEGFGDDAGEAFATNPDPQMLAYKVVWLSPDRDEAGLPVIRTNPPLPDIVQDTRIRFVPNGSCASLKRYLSAKYADGVLQTSGTLPESCIGKETFINMLDMQDFAARSFVNQWNVAGGQITAGYQTGEAPAQAQTLAIHRSPPLRKVLKRMNKSSNNVIARTVFLTMGAHASESQTVQNAEAAVRRELVKAGLDDEALILENGSGLSRRERVTARLLGNLLAKAYQSPFRQAFVDTLPISGTDGTLERRFKSRTGELYLKTGTLKNVRALAGYYLPRNPSAHPLVIVVLVNSDKSDYYVSDIDKLVQGLLPPPQ